MLSFVRLVGPLSKVGKWRETGFWRKEIHHEVAIETLSEEVHGEFQVQA